MTIFRKSTYLIITLLILALSSCEDEKSLNTELNLVRFDNDLLAFDTTNFQASENTMLEKYPVIYPFYVEQLMGIGSLKKEPRHYYYGNYFPEFLSGEYTALMDSFKNRVTEKDINKQTTILNEAYKNVNTIFNANKSPEIYSFMISPMGQNSVAAFSYGNDTIGINWFHYLGEDFTFYKPIFEGYSYMIPWKNMEYLPRNIMLVEYNLLDEKEHFTKQYNELIFSMINEGKKYYFLDEVCDVEDNVKIGFTDTQLDWCVENEFEIWAYFKDKKLLYNTERHQHIKHLKEGPTTTGMPKESPGMVGAWVGWQIVKKFAETSGKPPLQVLKSDAKDILTHAKYKPKK